MTKSQFNQIMREVRSIRLDGYVPDEAAFDMARDILSEHKGLEEYINKYCGASDAVGWLMQKI